jgi:cytochrome bd ubiquinol oxidase subunit II
MTVLAEIPAFLILLGIAAYIVLAGADFGAPFWALTARGRLSNEIGDHTHRSMAPVWEANHVWLIFVLVVCWTAYPEVFASIFSTLWIPLMLAAIGIIMRAVSYVVGGVDRARWVAWLATVASFLVPFMLGTVIGAIASGRVPVGNAQGDLISSWLNPTSITIGLLAIAVCAYLAAVYLAADAGRRGEDDLAEAFRLRGLAAGVVAGAVATGGVLVLREDSRLIYDGLTTWPGTADLAASALFGLLTMGLLWARNYRLARFAAAAAVATVVAGWGIAQSPDILPGLSVEAAASDDNVIIALLVAIAIGLLVLVPSLLLLYGLVLGGRFDPGADHVPEEASLVPGRPIGPGSRLPAVAAISAGALGAGLGLAFDGGPLLYIGFALLLGSLVACCVLLAFSLVRESAEGSGE